MIIFLYPEVLGHVYDFHSPGYCVLLQEGLALAVAEAKEYHIDLVERHVGSEVHVCVANKSFMDIGHAVASVALAVGKDYLCLRMVK